ncbi:MAG: response regulator [Dehalococcoidia bacterium]
MRRRVMIVDDEPSIRFTVQVVLKTAGFDVIPIESGKRCIEELAKGFKGVILMDVMMQQMNGWDTVKEINSRGLAEGNIISMLTAKEFPDADMEKLTESVINYMKKPFEPRDLIANVEEYCRWLEGPQSGIGQQSEIIN